MPASLIERPPLVEALDPEQIAKFDPHTMWARDVDLGNFTVATAVQALEELEGSRHVGVDMGGDKISWQPFEIQDGISTPIQGIGDSFRSQKGRGYIRVIKTADRYAEEHNLGLGISYAGPLYDSRPLYGPNVGTLVNSLKRRYDGDFRRLVRTYRALGNDAVTGLVESSIQIERENPGLDIIYLINGGGIGTSLMINGVMYAAEGGHVEALDRFNPYRRQEPCGMRGAKFTCVENIAASKAGIESTWFDLTGKALDGKGIEKEFINGNKLAANLYDNSALLVAHTIVGLAVAFNLNLDPKHTAVVGHGGAFKFPGYLDRVVQYLSSEVENPRVMSTYSFSENACLAGAATMAALAKPN